MIYRAFWFLSSEVRGLHTAVYVLAASALLSSLLALVRDRLLAHAFGASTTLDLYYAAFRIPDFIFVATGALVSVYILIPELARRDSDAQKDYIDTILVGFSILAVIVALTAAALAPTVLSILFPQFVSLGYLPTLVALTRILLLQPILLGLSNILAAITQTRSRYALYALSPLLYNVGIIIGVLVLYPIWGVAGLALGVVLGASAHFGIQIPSVFADGFFHRIPRLWEPQSLLRTVRVSVPRALALSMSQLTFLGLTALAATLAPGSIAVFMFAYNLQAVSLAVIGASYSVAAFPTLAAALSRGERDAFIEHVSTAARYVFFWSLPATALAIVLRANLVRVVLGSGAFDWTDTRLTAAAFAILSLSLAAQGLMLLLVRAYYAAGRTFMPFLINVGITIGTIGLGALLVSALQDQTLLVLVQKALRLEDIPGSSMLALAFSYSAIAIVGAAGIVFHFERRFAGFLRQVRRAWGESILAALGGGAGTYAALALLGPITLISTTLSVFTRGFVAGVFGIIVTALLYYCLGSREYGEIIEAIRGRMRGMRYSIPQSVVVSAEEGSPTTPQ